MADILPQGPMKHCQSTEPHPAHSNERPDIDNVWCNGVPELEPFVELAIRIPLKGKNGSLSHEGALRLIGARGLGMFVDGMREDGTATVLRVRTGEGKDKVYPVIDRKEAGGLTAVVMPPYDDAGATFCEHDECLVDHNQTVRPA